MGYRTILAIAALAFAACAPAAQAPARATSTTAASPSAVAAGGASSEPTATPAQSASSSPAPAESTPLSGLATAPVGAAPTSAATATPKLTPPPATASPTNPPLSGGTTISVVATDTSFKLTQLSVPAGLVTFSLRNSGSAVHELDILKTDLPQNQIPADPNQPGKMLEPGLVGTVPNLAPGATASVTLNLTAGSYVLMCNQPAHYLIGMHIGFTVTAVAQSPSGTLAVVPLDPSGFTAASCCCLEPSCDTAARVVVGDPNGGGIS